MIEFTKEEIIQKIKEKAEKIGKQPTKRNSSEFYYFSRKYFGSWGKFIRAAGFNLKELQKPIIPQKLSPYFFYFLGLLITDGHISKYRLNSHKILLFTSYPKERNLIIKLIKELFNYNASIRTKKYAYNKVPNYEIYISSSFLAKYINKKFQVPFGAKSKLVRVPAVLFSSNELNINAFIRGVIDGDGTISKKARLVRIASGSIAFLRDIKKLLSKINISSGKIRKEKNTFIISISGKENLRKLANNLYIKARFFYPRKERVWKDI